MGDRVKVTLVSAPFLRISIIVAAGLMLFGCAAGLLSALEQHRNAAARAEQLGYLPKGEYLRLAVLGYRQLVADLLWLQVVQHIGRTRDTPEGYNWTYHAVDVLTDLDQKFVAPYQATGILLGVLAGHHEEAIAILIKGMHNNPEVWQLPFLAGYISYYERCDPIAGARFLRLASHVSGAPAYLPRLAARMTVESGDPMVALEFLERFARSVQDERVREALALRGKEVLQERDVRMLEEGVRRYYAQYQRFPSKLDDLLPGGFIQQLPADPLGGEYRIDRVNGLVDASSRRERLRIHEKVACRVGRNQRLDLSPVGSTDLSLAVPK